MYARLDEILEDAERRAEAAALEERQRYSPFLEAAEKYAAEEGLVVCGEAATRLLLGGPVRFDSFSLALLGGGAEAHAAALARAFHRLAPDGLGHYAMMRPGGVGASGGGLFAVAVDGRDLVTVEEAPALKGVRATDVLLPTRRPAQFARREGPGAPIALACVGPELRLLDVYAALCDPARAGEWAALLAAEAGLRALLCRELRPKLRAAGAEGAGPESGRAALGAFLRAARDTLALGAGRALVGAGAVALLGGRAGGGRLQLVSEHPLEAERARLAALAAEHGLSALGTIHDPRVPGAPKLRRLTFYVQHGGRREPAVEVFDAAARELVPFVLLGAARAAFGAEGGRRSARRRAPAARPAAPGAGPAPEGLRLGNLFVLLRFRLVDLWTMLLLVRLGAADRAYGLGVLRETLDSFEAAAALYERLVRGGPERAAAQLLPAALIGRAEDAALEQKMAALRRPGRRAEPLLAAAPAKP
jgi:hypothetical protein